MESQPLDLQGNPVSLHSEFWSRSGPSSLCPITCTSGGCLSLPSSALSPQYTLKGSSHCDSQDPGSRGKCYTGHYCNSLELCTSWEHPIHVTLSWIWSFCWGYLRAGPWGRGEEWEKNVRKGWGENTHVVKMWAISDSRCVATPFILFRHFLLIWKFQKVKLKFFHTLLLYVFL